MEKFNLLHLPFANQYSITPLPILPPYLSRLPPRPHHSPHFPNYQTLRHGSDPVTVHRLIAIHLITLDPDMAEGDVFLRKGVRRFGEHGVAFERYDALDSKPFRVRRGPVVALISLSSSFSASPSPQTLKALDDQVERYTDRRQPSPSPTLPRPSTSSPTPDRSPDCCCNPCSGTGTWMTPSRS